MAINVNIPSQFREYANLAAFPATGSAKILYVAKNTNKLYRWDTSAYVEVSASAASSWGNITGTLSNQTDLQSAINGKQDTLVSGTNIKTVNSTSILGSGDLAVQDTLVSGTNIKTINGSSVLGSGDLTISGGASGIHALLKLTTGQQTSPAVTATTMNSTALIANRLISLPFIPNQTFTCSNLYINAGTTVVGGLGRILIYSDVNGIPTTKLYESADLDLSIAGIKTATTSFTFTQGTTYWLTIHANSNNSVSSLGVGSLMLVRTNGVSQVGGYGGSATFGSAPTTYPSLIFLTSTIPCVFITAS
jgi:hypothetical protein